MRFFFGFLPASYPVYTPNVHVVTRFFYQGHIRAIPFLVSVYFATSALLVNTAYSQSPGNIATNLAWWLKANKNVEKDASANAASDLNNVYRWKDQSSSAAHATQTTSANQPIYQDNVSNYINYNPCIKFTNAGSPATNDFMGFSNPATGNFDVYIVLKTSQTTTKTDFWYQPLIYGGDQNEALKADMCLTLGSTGKLHLGGGYSGDYNVDGTTSINSGTQNIIQVSRSVAGTSSSTFNWRINGGENGSSTRSETGNGRSMPASIRLGQHINTDSYSDMPAINGSYGEVFTYSSVQSSANRNKLETYLGVKYGITLSNSGGGTNGDYTSSAGTLIWDASDGSGYHNSVIGIGRDDNEALLQKQSKTNDDTLKLYIGSLATSNSANTSISSDYGADNAYIMLGTDGAILKANSTSNAEKPSGVATRVLREWKVTNTNFTGTFSLQITLPTAANLSNITASDLRLLVDDDGNFSNATVYASGGGLSFSYSSPTITLSGISNTHIGSNSTKYITIGSANISSTPLPVELTDFTAACEDKNISLHWVTAMELHNDYFVIERSEDGSNFSAIGIMFGAGNSNTLISYTWQDASPLNTLSYYRLKQMDYNGEYAYSKTISIAGCRKEQASTVYPNPVSTAFNIAIESDLHASLSLEFFDMQGKLLVLPVSYSIVKGDLRVYNADISSFPSGVYALRLTLNGEVKNYFINKL